MKRKILALVISIAMVLSTPMAVFASEGGQFQNSDNLTADAVTAAEDVDVQSENSEWTAEDFTYGDYEKLLYGCDYERQITISGVAITGFSESGAAKVETNKDLVIPAADTEGNTIVAVGEGAFRDQGLTSVTFPTGMMVDYDDTVTNRVTKRGNFIIAESAFANNELTEVDLPEGVIAVLPSAFQMNKIETVSLPRTIWWLETQAFARNMITEVNFPTTCDFQLEMHGMTFANNFIESIRLPDFTEVVNKTVFAWNTGMEPLAEDAQESLKTYKGIDGETYEAGVVYMYADNAELEIKDRIHHTGKETESQHSDVQKLVINDGSEETQNPNQVWTIDDFTVEGTVVTGLSASGIAKRAEHKDLVIPDMTSDGQYITEIAAAEAGGNGLFATEEEQFDSVELPNELQKIGNFAFQNSGLKEVQFPARLQEIGISAFSMNQLTSVILPDTVTTLGGGAFSSNPTLERISLSSSLTEIPAGAFGCSDQVNYMEKLTSIDIPDGVTSIGQNAFAGNNFHEIEIPSSVKKIDNYAFSTKEYLTDPCTLVLNEGLETIGKYAFRNKTIAEVEVPSTVTKIAANAFAKVYSSGEAGVVTKLYVSQQAQYEDKDNFPSNDYQKVYLTDDSVWTAEDFTYGEESFALYPADDYSSVPNITAWVVTGLSETGEAKIGTNKDLVIPAEDPDGRKVQGVGASAFYRQGITSLTLPEGVTTAWDDAWGTDEAVTERGDFFIGASAFLGNELTTLELPEGVIYIGNNAFGLNKNLLMVKFPETVMQISNQAFAQCSIVSLVFPENTDFPLQIDAMAFGANDIVAVQIPGDLEKLDKNAFVKNTGIDGAVALYLGGEKGGFVATSKYHTVITDEEIPAELAPWGVDDFTYDGEGTTITGLSAQGQAKIKNNAALVLPEKGPSGQPITALGKGQFGAGIFTYEEGDKNYAPSALILPATLKIIGQQAMAMDASIEYETATLTTITLPDGLESIGIAAFQGSSIESVSLPDSVTSLGSGAFSNTALKSLKLSKGLTEIPQSAFLNGASDLASSRMEIDTVVIPEGVTTIGRMAFSGAQVNNLTLPSTLTEIAADAFNNNKLTSVTIPASVTEIGDHAFRVQQEGLGHNLTSLTLNEGLQVIGEEAFAGSSLTETVLPSSVEELADDAFINGTEGVVTLRTASQEQVEKFNNDTANRNSHIVVYDKLVGTGWTADDFTYDEETGAITGWSDSGNQKRLENHELVLPDKTPSGKDIVAIGDNAFEIPDNEIIVTKFGIESPNGMTSVVLPAGVTSIGDRAFAQNALTEVDFSTVTSIGVSAFYGNQLTAVSLPDTVTELGQGAFATNNITELKLSAGVTKIPQGAFSMNIRLEQVTIPDTVTEIGEMAFAGARLTSLTIPESVVKIDRKAFHLHHLTELTIPGNVKEIGESAFEGTYKATTLKKLVIEEGVETIGKYAFKEALLETVQFPSSIKSVGEQPFLNNKGKDGSHVVEVTTYNPDHLAFGDDTYKVVYIGTYDITDYADKVQLEYDSVEYTGSAHTPKVTIDGLTEGTDYAVSYSNNTEVGQATVTITGMGSYEGTITKTFTITEKINTGDSSQDEDNPSQGGDKPSQGGDNPSQDEEKPSGSSDQDNPSQGGNDSSQGDDDETVKTGDESQILLWLVLLLISSGVIVSAKIYNKKEQE